MEKARKDLIEKFNVPPAVLGTQIPAKAIDVTPRKKLEMGVITLNEYRKEVGVSLSVDLEYVDMCLNQSFI